MIARGCEATRPLAVIVASVLLCCACAPVEPWERGTLARPEMALDPHPLQRAASERVYGSREAAAGGDAGEGGGCGCE